MKTRWEVKDFEDCLEDVVYTNKIQRKDFLQSGKFPIISQEKESVNGYWNEPTDVFKLRKPVVIFGDHTQILKYVETNFVLGADGVKILQPVDELNTRFFYYFLGSVQFSSLGYARHYKLLKDLRVPVPPLSEQNRIVAILDEALTAIATARENVEKNLKNARELFESYLQSVFAKPGKEWDEKDLSELTEVKDGTHDSPKYQREGIPFVTQKNVTEEGLSLSNTKFISTADHDNFYRRSNVAYGDILISMIGANRGMACLVDNKTLFSIKNVCLVKASSKINQDFLLYYLKSPKAKYFVKTSSKGGAQEFIGLTELRKFPIPLAPIEEQGAIVSKLNELSGEAKKLEAIYQQKLAGLEELKKSILQKAFGGELKGAAS
jgi:type I restriction enzyme, S subunit